MEIWAADLLVILDLLVTIDPLVEAGLSGTIDPLVEAGLLVVADLLVARYAHAPPVPFQAVETEAALIGTVAP